MSARPADSGPSPALSSGENPTAEKKFLHFQSQFVQRYAVWIVIFFTLITALLMPSVARLKLHANFLDLLPPTHPSISNLKELMSHVGGTSFLIAVIESPNEAAARTAAEKFTEKVNAFTGLEYVDNRTSVPALENRKLLFLTTPSLEKMRKDVSNLISYHRRKNNPFFVDLLEEEEPRIDPGAYELEEKVSKIGGFVAKEKNSFMRVVLIKPSHPLSDFTTSKKLFEKTTAAFEEVKKDLKQPVTMGLTGPYKTRFDEYATILHDLRWTGTLTVIFITLIMLIAFRSLRPMIYIFVPLTVGILWTCAFTQAAIGYLNLITAFLLCILMGMAIDYAIHLYVSLQEDIKVLGSVRAALENTYSEIWKPLVSSLLTTSIAFFALTISQFEGFRHFGIIAGTGIILSFIVIFYMVPSLVVIGERWFPSRPSPDVKPRKENKRVIYAILIAGFVFTVYSLTQIPRMTFNYNFADLQARDNQSIALAERIGEHFGVHLNPFALMTPDRGTASSFAKEINDYIDSHPDTSFEFAAAITSHMPRDQEEKIRILREIDTDLEKRSALISKLEPQTREDIDEFRHQLKATPLSWEELPAGFVRQYEGEDQKISIIFVYPNMRILDGKNGKRFIKEARSLKLPPGVQLAGEPVIYADILNLLEHDTPISMGLSMLVVILLLFIHFRRPDHVFWVLLPVLMGILWMVGMIGTIGLPFNFFNVAILPSIIGVGIDNGIYIFDRYRQKGNESFFESMRKTRKGVILSSLTTMSAFGSMLFATHVGMASMGKLGFFGFLSCLLTSVFFVPAVIEFFELHAAHLFRRRTDKP